MPSLDLSFIRAQRLKLGEKSAYQMGKVDKKETMKQVGTLQRNEADRIMDENRNRKTKKAEEDEQQRKSEASAFLNEFEEVNDNDPGEEF